MSRSSIKDAIQQTGAMHWQIKYCQQSLEQISQILSNIQFLITDTQWVLLPCYVANNEPDSFSQSFRELCFVFRDKQ